jgi:putative flippase GtrA
MRFNTIFSVEKIKKLTSKPVGRYIIVGVSVYLFEVITIVVAKIFQVNDVFAIALSFWLGLFASFLLQKLVTFGDKRFHRRFLLVQFLAFSGLVAFNFAFTICIGYLLQGTVPAVISRTIALGITTFWNFYLYKTRIFKLHPEEPPIY